MSLNHTECPIVLSLCALPDDVLLLACGAEGLRSVSLSSAQLSAHKLANVYEVAFDEHTNTLLLIMRAPRADNKENVYWLVSLRRNASEWLEVMRLPTNFSTRSFNVQPAISVCGSRVLLTDFKTLYVFNVSAKHSVIGADPLSVKKNIFSLACTRRDGETLVAFAHSSSVSLHRLASVPLRLEWLAEVDLYEPFGLLFSGDVLLVSHTTTNTSEYAIVSLRASGNALTERRVLLDTNDVEVDAWTLACERLVQWDFISNGLLVYAFA